jgi:hypothetical protein
VGPALPRQQKAGTDLRTGGAQRQRGEEAAAIHNPTGGNHRNVQRIHDLRY